MPNTLTDAQLKQILADSSLTPEELGRLTKEEQVRLGALRASSERPQMPWFIAPPTPTGPDTRPPRRPNPSSFWENTLALPSVVGDMFHAARPFTIPAAGLLGGIGAGIDSAQNPDGLDLTDVLKGLMRQGGLAATGRLLSVPAARGMIRGANPKITTEAAEAALTPSVGRAGLKRPFGPGLSQAGTDQALEAAGQRIGTRIESYPAAEHMTPRIDLLSGSEKMIDKEVGKSMKEQNLRAIMEAEVKDSLKGPGPNYFSTPKGLSGPDLTPLEVAAKKQGARVGYESQQNKAMMNLPQAPPTKVQELTGDNAQRVLEEIDAATTGSRSRFSPPLKRLNQRYGGYRELQQALVGNSGGGLLRRGALGAMAGGLGQSLVSGGGEGQSAMTRYGPGGIAGGLAYGFAPGVSAQLVKALGELGPTAIRMMGAHRRTPKAE